MLIWEKEKSKHYILQKQTFTILSDLHGRKKQKHFGLFTFLFAFCTNMLHKMFNLKLKHLHQTHAVAFIFFRSTSTWNGFIIQL